ncbi:putative tRNA(His) guanylyltransferase [Leucoagaricus sp. SymC.cos]|nr:putative tRNA(His) guanylyltransferase [Leucoagaricus sp. SymC.cos]
MANTKYAYVRNFELPDPLLPGTFLVFRLDGHSFHRFSDVHNFAKPNDVRALELMDHAARDTMEVHPDIVLAFGESDEFSFLLKKSTSIYSRRQSKILSTLTSQFTSSYVFHWSKYFPNTPLQYPPSFDGRIVLYPTEKEVKDYFAWRQADTHINNLYNTTFWALQQGGQTTTEAHATLRGTFSKDKNEILFSRFKINYNTIDPRFRKGSVLVREETDNDEETLTPESQESVDLESFTPAVIISQTPFSLSGDERSKPTIDDHTSLAQSDTNAAGSSTIYNSNPRLPTLKVRVQTGEPTRTNTTGSDSVLKGKAKSKMKSKQKQKPTRIILLHCDLIRDEFWSSRPELLSD